MGKYSHLNPLVKVAVRKLKVNHFVRREDAIYRTATTAH